MNAMDQGWIVLFEVGLFWLITYVFLSVNVSNLI